ncbi:Pyridoxine/pyridoxamine 5'-phosphate oxidase [Acanthamoeba castellanii str. Neff]|uniref:pyridoxal 5'-phosphate synthase n=1 Tax=Acanthamoeba castellanii (strain ATCC 30010 / Neff) TaxID=1257118 RepID=L8GEX9_ACACF|nr:Pyridoxine/pyridoxamine 5'-phosphate oxidase [Acanthamoeba castellanii str. Neff]ELR11552.1 Pyridoxine/pyridoxamine 5'-phosphate oxidase [Acanthamoeba castellanii str. Neff]
MWDEQVARQLEENPRPPSSSAWPETLRQVRITGVVHKVTKRETEMLFRLCSRVEQICFYALSQGQDHPFNQSNDEPSHQERAEYLQGMMDRYMLSPQDVPLPAAWGGFRLVPDTIEFLDTRAGWTQRTLYHRTLGLATTPSVGDQGAAATDVPVGEWQRKYLVP